MNICFKIAITFGAFSGFGWFVTWFDTKCGSLDMSARVSNMIAGMAVWGGLLGTSFGVAGVWLL